MIIDYIVVTNSNEEAFAHAVKLAIKDGWQLHGNICTLFVNASYPDLRVIYSQVLIKTKE